MSSTETNKNWYLLTCKPNQDSKAEQHLTYQDYEIYRPLITINKKVRGKITEITKSLFPRYIFINLDPINDNWAPIRSTRGVSGFVKFGIEPCMIPEELIQTLKKNESNFNQKDIDLKKFKSGEIIQIDESPFKGLQAAFSCYDKDEKRSFILIEILGNIVDMKVETKDISRL